MPLWSGMDGLWKMRAQLVRIIELKSRLPEFCWGMWKPNAICRFDDWVLWYASYESSHRNEWIENGILDLLVYLDELYLFKVTAYCANKFTQSVTD